MATTSCSMGMGPDSATGTWKSGTGSGRSNVVRLSARQLAILRFTSVVLSSRSLVIPPVQTAERNVQRGAEHRAQGARAGAVRRVGRRLRRLAGARGGRRPGATGRLGRGRAGEGGAR